MHVRVGTTVAEQRADDRHGPASAPGLDLAGPVKARAARRRPRARVVVLGLVVAVALAVAGGAFALLNAGSGPSPIEAYAPRDAAGFAEVRLDAPGDQKLALAQLALRVPGLRQPPDATGEMARDVASLVGAATGQRVDGYAADVRSWAGATVGAAAFLPADGGAPRLLAIIGVRDVPGAGTWADGYLAAAGGAGPTEAVRAGSLRHGAGSAAIAVVDGSAFVGEAGSVLLAGAEVDVRAALDAATNRNGLVTTDRFRAARAALPGDELGRAFVDVDAARSWLAAGGAWRPDWSAGPNGAAEAILARLPAWTAVRVRAEGDAILVQEANAAGAPSQRNATAGVAANLPPDTVAVLDVHDAGALLAGWLDALRTAGAGTTIDTMDGAIAGAGGLEGILAQLGTADALATWDGSRLRAGVVIRSADPSATRKLLDSVRALAAFAKAPLTDQAHGDTTIITAEAPAGIEVPLVGPPTVEVAMRGDLLIIGVGSGFAASVLDAGPGRSLADQPAYQRAVARAGAPGTASCFVDAQAARMVGERLGVTGPTSPSPSASASAAGDATRVLDALEALGCNARDESSADTITLALTVR